MQRFLFGCGAVYAFATVAIAALTTHALAGASPAALQMIRTALQMQGWHSFALLAAAVWLPRGGGWTVAAGLCFVVGTPLFCSAVYGLALGWFHLKLVAPFGGSLLMAGWLLLALGALRAAPPATKRRQQA